MASSPVAVMSRKRKASSSNTRILIKVFIGTSVFAVIVGSYWQQQLLKGVDIASSSSSYLLQHWEAGLPRKGNRSVVDTNSKPIAVFRNESNAAGDSTALQEQQAGNNATNDSSNIGAQNDTEKTDTARIIRQDHSNITIDMSKLPTGFQSVLKRSQTSQEECLQLPRNDSDPPPTHVHSLLVGNVTETIADLPDFGILPALLNYTNNATAADNTTNDWQCQVPPPTECNETQFTAIFMGYNPDRLGKLKQQVWTMTHDSKWKPLVREVVLVWNGERNISETDNGQRLLKLAQDHTSNFRISFPLLQGFPNDLMNRYHPSLNITTKAILFYDDDGPFYSYNAVTSGFELWKRNSNAQIGAMARKIDLLGQRQQEEASKLDEFDDHAFITHCAGDQVKYNFREFANYGARMVLPSGSFLHSNYLCFLWHPALEEVRDFVRQHPVHPDDITVSTIVSHVSGRAPKVYSRRMNPKPQVEVKATNETAEVQDQRRRLQQQQQQQHDEYNYPRRRLLWQDVSKNDWASMRSMAINSLVSYFGGINSGSLGWCHNTPYQQVNRRSKHPICKPEMADIGILPWMTEDNAPKETCP